MSGRGRKKERVRKKKHGQKNRGKESAQVYQPLRAKKTGNVVHLFVRWCPREKLSQKQQKRKGSKSPWEKNVDHRRRRKEEEGGVRPRLS